jgi:cobalt-zinc-cadmium efflux system protein
MIPVMHAHAHEPPAAGASGVRSRLLMTLLLTGLIMLAEAAGGYMAGSLALMADAGHMLTDFLALIVAFAAMSLAQKPADDRRTYGYRRLEILAALANGVALVVLSGSIFYESVQRWMTPRSVNVPLMAAIAFVGLIANLIGLSVLRGARENLNVRGAFLHILGDTLSSAGVVLVAGLMAVTGWERFDAVISFVIAVVIIITSVSLLREVLDVLLEAAPRNIDTDKVRQTIAGAPGVSAVHDLHIWSIASGLPALSAHVVVSDPAHDSHAVREVILEQLRHEYAIEHATLQMEREDDETCGCCAAGGKRGSLGHAGAH